MSTANSPGRLLRYTISIYRNKSSSSDVAENFSREYVKKIAPLHAKHGMEMYQIVYSPLAYRTALDSINRRDGRGFIVDDHDVTVEFYFRSFAELSRVTSDPEFQAAQAAEAPYVNLVHTVVSLGWVEKYVDGGRVVNIGDDGKSAYPSWAELGDISTAFPKEDVAGATKWSVEGPGGTGELKTQ
ncbi:hypothetical protein PFICI_05868 [Pestalotiopsis fici W106-1]|uniref:EthD domain-containing protein n=1 Tax=Pestalotiopsis fici (strain W106-1 / CGMCC3.15140) TaxID=1229662 RepID=W3XEZ3_PESFW|nr:uncharacterized protein PFICI_05868 [Pestalotiopsis fici W106-1]ETS83992.1 hypothetical protein PFICI_05868 [Pestalotiopsis fici W106-1]